MKIRNSIIKGAFILTLAGLLSKFLGFFYRIFLSRTLGSSGMGLYQLCFTVSGVAFALCCAGIPTAISKYVAEHKDVDKKKILFSGIGIAFPLSLFISLIVYENAYYISTYILHESSCESLIRCMCLSIPLSAVHACVSGYYLGLKKASVPALSQLVEQLVRVASVYIIWLISTSEGKNITPLTAMIGTVLGETGAILVCVLALSIDNSAFARPQKKHMINITKFAFPLTLNRIMLTFLQSIEAILIPFMLRSYGMTSEEALGVYGILTGMAMSFILFPSTVIQSISVMLLPEVAGYHDDRKDSLSRTTNATLRFCICMGILCTGIFVSYGNAFGSLIFDNSQVGLFITILAWICPFLYANITLSSVLNGLGKTTLTLLLNVIGTGIKLIFIIFLIPHFGIPAYMWGLLASSISETILYFIIARKYVALHFDAGTWIISPIYTIVLAIGITFFINHWIFSIVDGYNMTKAALSCLSICMIFFTKQFDKIKRNGAD